MHNTRKQPSKGVGKGRPDLQPPLKYATLKIKVENEEQIKHIHNAENELALAGVTFDTGHDLVENMVDWELDWSLEGAYLVIKSETKSKIESTSKVGAVKGCVQVLNPRTKRWVKIDGESGKVVGHKKSLGPYKKIPIYEGEKNCVEVV